jgi:hypothetical protein
LVTFDARSSYHVLWKTTQRAPAAGDGRVRSRSFEVTLPDPAGAYESAYPETAVEVFGEWERLPAGGVMLAPGDYTFDFVLTEESFHGGGLAGGWASAVGAGASVTIVPGSGDFDSNGAVGLGDFSVFAGAYGSVPGDPEWNALCDLDANDFVGLGDFSLFAGFYGTTYSYASVLEPVPEPVSLVGAACAVLIALARPRRLSFQ